MNRLRVTTLTAIIAIYFSTLAGPASALSITEFKKYPLDKQAVYVTGAVSITAYTYATTGEVAKAHCIKQWYFGHTKGEETPGPHDLAIEIAAAERVDPGKDVEGVILGLTDKVCGAPAPAGKK